MAAIAVFFYASENPKYNCQKCLTNKKGRIDFEEKNREYRARKGCFGAAFKPNEIKTDQFTLTTLGCFGNFTDNYVGYLYSMFNMWEKGILPYKGCLLDQPAKIVECFDLIVSLREERIKQIKKEKERLSSRK